MGLSERETMGEASRAAERAGGGGLAVVAARSVVGGVLMGLANLVPGISGGTMLLAAGVYRAFVGAVADATTLRFRWRSVVVLGCVVGAALVSIVLLAGPVKTLVVERRWVMYALFVGLTLGGVPLVWGMLRRAGGAGVGAWAGFVAAIGAMAALAFGFEPGAGGGGGFWLLVIAGAAGASAMILPGLSGGYLLLILGVYTTILGSIDDLKEAVRGRDVAAALAEWSVVVPVGLGVVVGVAGLSNLIRWLLRERERPTLGVLLGLLVGSVLGLWPFQETVRPEAGDVLKGMVVSEVRASSAAEGGAPVAVTEAGVEIGREDWATGFFVPSVGQLAGAAGLIAVGFGVTVGISAFGRVRGSGEAGGGREAATGAQAEGS